MLTDQQYNEKWHALVSEAGKAYDYFSEDELEEYANSVREKNDE